MDYQLVASIDDVKDLRFLDCLAAWESAVALEDLLTYWLDAPGRSVSLRRNDHGKKPGVGISFVVEKEAVAVGIIPTGELLRWYGKLDLLNEEPLSDASDEWFDKRNQRLEIDFDEALQAWTAPVSSLPELILSYSLASNAIAHLEIASESSDFIELQLIFFRDSKDPEWGETFLIERKELEDFVTAE